MSRVLIRLTFVIAPAVYALLIVAGLIAAAPLRAAKLPADPIVDPGESIQAAIDAANDGDTIVVNAGRYTESLTLSKAISLTGVSSDTTIIHAATGQRVLTVTGTTISNSVVISGLTFTGGEGGYGGGLYLDAPLSIINSRFISNTAGEGGGIYGGDWFTPTSLTVTGTDFINNAATRGGGLYMNGAAWLSDVRFEDNTAADLGGAINARSGTLALTRAVFLRNNGSAVYSENSPATIADSRFEQNSGDVGGAVWIYAVGAHVSGTHFYSNTAVLGGGGVAMIGGRIVNSRFEGNTVQENWGGGLYAMGMTLVTNTEFISNAAQSNGGGAYFGDVELYDSRFEGNISIGGGGGGFFAFGTLISHTDFIGNQASCTTWGAGCGGGGAYAFNEATVVNSRFESNATPGNGGGLYANGALSIADSTFISNVATGAGGLFAGQPVTLTNVDFIRNAGGGAALGGPSIVTGGQFVGNQGGGLGTDRDAIISDTAFISNSADIGGGLYANYTATLYNARFEGNVATTYGGGLFAEHTDVISNSAFINNTAANGGGAAIGEMRWLSDTIFISNAASQNGGGLFGGGPASIVNALFARNSAGGSGAALRLGASNQVRIAHTTIASPTLVTASAVSLDNSNNANVVLVDSIIARHAIAIESTNGLVTEDYNVFFANLVTNTLGVIAGAHSFAADPRFVDPARDDYHLLLGSPAIDRGVDAAVYSDLDGNPRPLGAGFDPGAYEYAGPPCRVFLPLVH
jgi:predicted outer membrane repeat protein